MVDSIFWIFVGIVAYVYFGYPLLLIILSKFRTRPVKKSNITPSVSIIIAAYNEEKSIRKKLENTLSLDYPKDKLEIIVASDGSTDKTNEIVEQFRNRGVKLIYRLENRGKASIQNDAVKEAAGEIIILSDATGLYSKEAVRKIVENFNDKHIGCVDGALREANQYYTSINYANSAYWQYEVFLREKESQIGALAIASGSIFSIRKELFEPLDSAVSDDFVIPMTIAQKGYRVIYEPRALSSEIISSTIREKLNQKIRIVMLDVRGLFLKRALLNPLKYPLISLSLISHKLLRWLIPFFLLGILLTDYLLFNSSKIYQVAFLLQIILYLAALTGMFLQLKNIKIKPFYIPFYFCLLNLAALVGLYKFVSGKKVTRWVPDR